MIVNARERVGGLDESGRKAPLDLANTHTGTCVHVGASSDRHQLKSDWMEQLRTEDVSTTCGGGADVLTAKECESVRTPI